VAFKDHAAGWRQDEAIKDNTLPHGAGSSSGGVFTEKGGMAGVRLARLCTAKNEDDASSAGEALSAPPGDPKRGRPWLLSCMVCLLLFLWRAAFADEWRQSETCGGWLLPCDNCGALVTAPPPLEKNQVLLNPLLLPPHADTGASSGASWMEEQQ